MGYGKVLNKSTLIIVNLDGVRTLEVFVESVIKENNSITT